MGGGVSKTGGNAGPGAPAQGRRGPQRPNPLSSTEVQEHYTTTATVTTTNAASPAPHSHATTTSGEAASPPLALSLSPQTPLRQQQKDGEGDGSGGVNPRQHIFRSTRTREEQSNAHSAHTPGSHEVSIPGNGDEGDVDVRADGERSRKSTSPDSDADKLVRKAHADHSASAPPSSLFKDGPAVSEPAAPLAQGEALVLPPITAHRVKPLSPQLPPLPPPQLQMRDGGVSEEAVSGGAPATTQTPGYSSATAVTSSPSPSPSPRPSPSPLRHGDGEDLGEPRAHDAATGGAECTLHQRTSPVGEGAEDVGGPTRTVTPVASHGATVQDSGVPYRPTTRSVSPGVTLARDYSALPLTELQSKLRHNHRVLRVCLTGGPCAGKSTMLAEIQARIPQRTGYQVYCVPEAATMLVTGGMKWDASIALEQQLCLLRTQLALEDQFYDLAVASGRPTIVMSDRGTMDGRAFCSPEDFQEILRRLGCTLDVLRDRYDAVIHMVTAACGAERFYNLDNPARYEDLDGARASDLKLQQMYVGHPLFRLLDNSTSFDEKIERGLQLVSRLVGHDGAATQRTSYFLVRRCPSELPVPCATFRVRTVLLGNSQLDEMRLVQMRIMADGSRMHFFKSVRKGPLPTDQTPPPPPPPSGDSKLAFTRSHTAAAIHASTDASGSSREASSRASASATDVQRPLLQHQPNDLSGSDHTHSFASPRNQPRQPTGDGNVLGESTQDRVTSAVRISSKEYNCLVNNRDPQREVVESETTHFIYAGTNFEVTTILSPSWAAGKQTLTVEYDAGDAVGLAAEPARLLDSDATTVKPASAKQGVSLPLEIPEFVVVDREVPLDSTTTAFLISHRETGPLYTSLAFAPVFSQHFPYPSHRSSVSAIGPHADVENILHSTRSTPNRTASFIGAAGKTTEKPAAAQQPAVVVEVAPSEPAAAAEAADPPVAATAAPRSGALSQRNVNQLTPFTTSPVCNNPKTKLKLQTTRRSTSSSPSMSLSGSTVNITASKGKQRIRRSRPTGTPTAGTAPNTKKAEVRSTLSARIRSTTSPAPPPVTARHDPAMTTAAS